MTHQNLATGSGTYAVPLAVRKDDLYESPPEAIRALLSVEDVPKQVWEPACGPGAIVRELEAADHLVYASDLVDYGWGHDARRDFLMEHKAPTDVDCVLTNPPFKLAEEFASHALTLVPRVYLLLRLAFLEGLRWQERGLSNHLARVHIFAPRLPFMHRNGYEGPKNSNSGFPFAWFVWDKRHPLLEPTIDWIDWRAFK